MARTVTAVFENGVFKPKDLVDLDEHTEVELVVHVKDTQSAIELLEAWMEGDKREQTETWAYLKRVLDKDRTSSRRLFD